MAKTKDTSMISIQYQFIFSKDANIWNNINEFEQDISDFFLSNGLECNVVSTVRGSYGPRMILISLIPDGRTLKNPKGVDLKSKPGKPSQVLTKGFTNKLVNSFNKQYPGKKGSKLTQ